MRYSDFALTEDELFELNMSPTNLQRMAAEIDAQAGMEFEMIIPGAAEEAEDEYESEHDYEMDEGFPTGRGWRQEVIDFFRGGDGGSSRSTIQQAIDNLNEDYLEWKSNEFDNWLNQAQDVFMNTLRGQMPRQEGESDAEYEDRVQAEINEQGSEYDKAMDSMNEEFYDEDQWDEFLRDNDIGTMADFGNQYNVDWPYYTYPESTAGGTVNIDDVADDFRDAIGRPVNASSNYHGGVREAGKYVVEPDGSLEPDDTDDGGLEFVSPPLPLDEMLSDLEKVAKWASRIGAYTNSSTGLHMNVSVPNFDQDRLDYVKLAIFLGDEYVLDQFGRAGNTYCKSAMAQIKDTAKTNPDKVQTMLRQMQGNLSAMASKIVHTGQTSKYTSINTKTGYIEFRSPGGDWLGEYAADPGKITNTLLRFVVALDIAMKPELYRQEYMKKLYKTLDQGDNSDTIKFFAQFSAGELPQSALKSFVKQAQLQRQRGKEEKEQVDTLHKELTGSHPEGRGRPHDPNGRYAIVSRQDPAAYQTGRGTAPEYQFRFNMSNPAEQHNGRYILAAWAARNGVDPASYMIVDTEQWDRPAVTGSTQDLQRQRLAAQMPRHEPSDGNWEIYKLSSGNTVYKFLANTEEEAVRAFNIWQDVIKHPDLPREDFNLRTVQPMQAQSARGSESLPPGNARWLILDRNDREVYSFINTTAQSDANQYARNWMINTATADIRDRGPFNIVPVSR